MMVDVVEAVLKRSLAALDAFPCPTHHRHYYQRTRDALLYLLQPACLSKLVFLRNATFAPVCADLVPDSGVAFLRGICSGPMDIAAEAERSDDAGAAVFQRTWADALGIEFEEWQPLADRSPVIFVRLGASVLRPDGRWEWALLDDDHLLLAYESVQEAFDHLEQTFRLSGDAERLDRLLHLRYGVIPA